MKFKSVIVAVALLAALPFSAKAQNVENYEEYQVSCEQGVECNDFNVMYEQQEETSEEIAQRTRPRRTRRSSDFKKIYVGGTLGLAELGDGADLGFGASIVGGYRITKNIAAELEIYDYFGGTDSDDLGYNYLGILANGSYRIPFGDDPKSLYAFVTPGFGFGRLGLTGDDADDLDDAGLDTSDTGFLLQIKAGVGYPISESLNLFGQARYANLFLSDFNGVDDDEDAITFDVGVNFGF
ncbi:MAG: porin family protein [Cyanobacteria bacterium P01_G01_bin.19]